MLCVFYCFPISGLHIVLNRKLKMSVPEWDCMFKMNWEILYQVIFLFFLSFLIFFPSPSWVSLVSKNYEIERTIVQLENEIYQIKQQHGEANKENIRQDFWLGQAAGLWTSSKPLSCLGV